MTPSRHSSESWNLTSFFNRHPKPRTRQITYLIATAGTLLSLPLILFSWIGAQTFVRQSEKALAILIFWLSVGLLALSALTFLHSNLATWDAIAAAAAALLYSTLWITGKLRRRKP